MIVHLIQELHAWASNTGDALSSIIAAAPTPGGGAPDPGNGVAPPGSEKILTLLQWMKWLFTAAAVGGGLIIAGKMVISHRRGDDTNVSHLGMWLGASVLAGVAPHLVDALI